MAATDAGERDVYRCQFLEPKVLINHFRHLGFDTLSINNVMNTKPCPARLQGSIAGRPLEIRYGPYAATVLSVRAYLSSGLGGKGSASAHNWSDCKTAFWCTSRSRRDVDPFLMRVLLLASTLGRACRAPDPDNSVRGARHQQPVGTRVHVIVRPFHIKTATTSSGIGAVSNIRQYALKSMVNSFLSEVSERTNHTSAVAQQGL
jgi:hypothetical protein